MFKPLKRFFANFNFQAAFTTCLIARLAVSLAIADIAVAGVFYSLNNGSWKIAVGTDNWSAALSLALGANTIAVYAVDTSGNKSTTNSLSIDCVLNNMLLVAIVGRGTITPNYNNAILQIGNNYKMTAKAAKGFAFRNWTVSTNWLDGMITNKATVQFTMASNLTLQATFADVIKPVLSITNLVNKQRLSNAVFTVKGKAKDNWQVGNVWLQLNGGDWTNAATFNQWTNWSADLNLVPGTNKLAVYAVDTGGNRSLTNSRSFLFIVPPSVLVQAVGISTTNILAITDWVYSSNGFSFTLQSSPGQNGRIQMSTDLTSWDTLTNFIGTNSTLNFRDPTATNFSKKFYRAVVP